MAASPCSCLPHPGTIGRTRGGGGLLSLFEGTTPLVGSGLGTSSASLLVEEVFLGKSSLFVGRRVILVGVSGGVD